MKQSWRMAAATLAVCIAFAQTGCSACGYLLGAGCDLAVAPTLTMEFGDLSRLKEETDLTVIRVDSVVLDGEYLGSAAIPGAEYAVRYGKWKEEGPDRTILPSVGDTIIVRYGSSQPRVVTGEFVGVSKMWLYLQTVSGWGEYRKITVSSVDLQQILTLKRLPGEQFDGTLIRETLAGAPRFEPWMALRTSDRSVTLPIDSVQHISMHDVHSTWKITFGTIGGLVDLSFILFLTSLSSQ